MPQYERMAPGPSVATLRDQFSVRLIASYALDWIILAIIAVVAYVLGRIPPNMRNFSLADRDISFPFTELETVPNWLLFVLCAVFPIVVIFLVTLVFVPGSTVPSNTPWTTVWKRKVWELQISWLGLLMAVGSSWFFVSGIKNMCGKPRPDMLARCKPDMENVAQYIVGGFQIPGANGQLVSSDICTETDAELLDDGFRSYPSGHAGASAAGLIYLSLYLASKFSVTIPFILPGYGARDGFTHSAFPSRMRQPEHDVRNGYEDSWPMGAGAGVKPDVRQSQHNQKLQSLRKQAAAPPVYLLAITLVPFCVSIFVSASRWFDYRHHGFDILFGYLIGIITSIYSFRYYHMPIRDGAGWAWAPRSPDRAFWAGVGRLGYAGERVDLADAASKAATADANDAQSFPSSSVQRSTGAVYPELGNRTNGTYAPQDLRGNPYEGRANGQYADVEMQRLNQERV